MYFRRRATRSSCSTGGSFYLVIWFTRDDPSGFLRDDLWGRRRRGAARRRRREDVGGDELGVASAAGHQQTSAACRLVPVHAVVRIREQRLLSRAVIPGGRGGPAGC